jgi:hypothetical protein
MPSRMAAPRRSVAGALAITAALGLSVAVAQSAAADVRVARQQLVAVLSTDHTVWQRPDGERLAVVVSALRPITHEATVLPVLRQTVDSAGRSWLLVRLPGRTLGSPSPPSTGWIASPGTQLRATPWHIVVDLAARELTVYNDGHAVRRFSAIVGKPTTPTPVGQYFVEEDVVMTAGAAGGPFALATSDRSDRDPWAQRARRAVGYRRIAWLRASERRECHLAGGTRRSRHTGHHRVAARRR